MFFDNLTKNQNFFEAFLQTRLINYYVITLFFLYYVFLFRSKVNKLITLGTLYEENLNALKLYIRDKSTQYYLFCIIYTCFYMM